jgi:hypothetical protein
MRVPRCCRQLQAGSLRSLRQDCAVPQIEITRVASRAERDAFIKFPWRIYANDPAWVPPLLLERKEFLNREKHPFYEHGDAALFLARSGGEIVGRIMASDDPKYNALHQSNVGCFGLFESVNDTNVAAALFQAAENWLRGKGRDEIMGPIDYSTNYVCGLLIDGFEHPPTVLTSHNPPYYAALIESGGFTKIKDFYAWWFPDANRGITRLRRLASKFIKRNSVSIRPGDMKNIREESRRLREIYNQAWEKNWGFVPFSESEIEYSYRGGKQPTGRLHPGCARYQRGAAKDRRPAHAFWFSDRPGQVALSQEQNQEGATHSAWRDRRISPCRRGRDARAASDGGWHDQTRVFLRAQHDVGRQPYDQSLSRSDRGLEIQDVSNLSPAPEWERDGVTGKILSFRRVLIVADESADWMVAGLRQLDRLALSVDEFASDNKETAPVLVCIFWRQNLDQAQRWVPAHERLTRVAFTTELDGEPFDLVLNTRLFLYRKAIRQLLTDVGDAPVPIPPSEEDLWQSHFRSVELVPRFRSGAWEFITDGEQIDEIEKRFLRDSGKPQDGLVSRYLNRPISRVVTRLLLRFPTTPNAWTLLIFSLPIIASLVLLHGSYWSFLWGLVLFQVFSVLDGCDGELARAKFLESERGRRLDDLCDILSNILLAVSLGFGLSRPASPGGQSRWAYLVEGVVAAALIGANEFYLATRKADGSDDKPDPLGGLVYPRHRELVARSGLLLLGKNFASWLIQLTKRDVAMLFFVFLAVIGQPVWILHLLLAVTGVSLVLAWRARLTL